MIEATIADFSNSMSAAMEFISQYPPAAGWQIGTVRRVREFVHSFPKNILQMRSPTLRDPSAVSTLRAMVDAGRTLCYKRRQLENNLTIRKGLRPSDIDGHIAILRNAGVFSFLSSKFKEAKSFYASISKANKFDRSVAISQLEAVSEYLEQEARFETRTSHSGVFGSRFDGIETDFESFNQLTDFYENLETELKGFSNRQAREFLRDEAVQTIWDTPDLPDLPGETILSDLETTRQKLKSDLEKTKSADVELSELCSAFVSAAAIRPDDLKKLSRSVVALETLVAQLEGSSLASVLGKNFAGWRTETGEIEYPLPPG